VRGQLGDWLFYLDIEIRNPGNHGRFLLRLVPTLGGCESIRYNPPPYQGGARGGFSVIKI